MTAHPSTRRTGVFGLALWCVALLALWPRAAHALTMYEYVRTLDYASAATFAGIAVVGGTAPTLLALLTDRFVVAGAFARTAKDIGIAAMAGTVFFVGVLAVESAGYSIPKGVALAGVLCAGWARKEFFALAGDGVMQVWRAMVDRVTGQVRNGARITVRREEAREGASEPLALPDTGYPRIRRMPGNTTPGELHDLDR